MNTTALVLALLLAAVPAWSQRRTDDEFAAAVGAAEKKSSKVPQVKLVEAAGAGNLDAVKAALKNGAAVNATGGATTALVESARRGHENIVKFLLSEKADVNGRTWWGETPLDAAVSGRHVSIVKTLLEAHADPNIANDWEQGEGFTPLMLVALHCPEAGAVEMTELLLAHGAKKDIKNVRGETALDLLRHYVYPEAMLLDSCPRIVELLEAK